MLAEQHHAWAEGRRSLGLESSPERGAAITVRGAATEEVTTEADL